MDTASDLLVEGSVIVEIKSVDALAPIHEAQVITYLKLSGCKLGLLINFNVPVLKTVYTGSLMAAYKEDSPQRSQRSRRTHGENQYRKPNKQGTVILANASRSAFLCVLCALGGESLIPEGSMTQSLNSAIIPGPTYAEMLDPATLPAALRNKAVAAARGDEFDPANLFNITWRGPDQGIRHVLLPKELTGVKANIVVMVGRFFPSGSHKVGPAYSTLMEGELAGEIEPGKSTTIGPSTGNFGIGVAYVSRLKGYPAIVIMPERMSAERYQRIRHYGGQLDLTPGSESDVILVLERTQEYRQDPRNKVLGNLSCCRITGFTVMLRDAAPWRRQGLMEMAASQCSRRRRDRPERWRRATKSSRLSRNAWSPRSNRGSAPRSSTMGLGAIVLKASATRW